MCEVRGGGGVSLRPMWTKGCWEGGVKGLTGVWGGGEEGLCRRWCWGGVVLLPGCFAASTCCLEEGGEGRVHTAHREGRGR